MRKAIVVESSEIWAVVTLLLIYYKGVTNPVEHHEYAKCDDDYAFSRTLKRNLHMKEEQESQWWVEGAWMVD
jgi:hypothetical protein